MLSVRFYLFLLLFGSWFWASSVFTPWAASTNPRLWLYDLLFYTRFVLLFWAAFELIYAWHQIRHVPGRSKSAVTGISVIGIAALAVSVNSYLMHTGIGFRARVNMSAEALKAVQKPVFADVRHRAGWFLIDTQRKPCGDQPWLWLGNAYGGGTGNNLALVYSANEVPKTPMAKAFRFWPVTRGWWLAYQNPQQYNSRIQQAEPCSAGEVVATHGQGMKFIAAALQDQ